jgi:hypothetical protein
LGQLLFTSCWMSTGDGSVATAVWDEIVRFWVHGGFPASRTRAGPACLLLAHRIAGGRGQHVQLQRGGRPNDPEPTHDGRNTYTKLREASSNLSVSLAHHNFLSTHLTPVSPLPRLLLLLLLQICLPPPLHWLSPFLDCTCSHRCAVIFSLDVAEAGTGMRCFLANVLMVRIVGWD